MNSVISLPPAALAALTHRVSQTSPDPRAETGVWITDAKATRTALLASRENLAAQCECCSRVAATLLADRFRAAAAQ